MHFTHPYRYHCQSSAKTVGTQWRRTITKRSRISGHIITSTTTIWATALGRHHIKSSVGCIWSKSTWISRGISIRNQVSVQRHRTYHQLDKNDELFFFDFQSIGITARKSGVVWTSCNRTIGQHSQFTAGYNGRYCADAQSTYEIVEHKQRKGMRSADGRRSWWHKRNANALHESSLFRFRWFGINTDPSQ